MQANEAEQLSLFETLQKRMEQSLLNQEDRSLLLRLLLEPTIELTEREQKYLDIQTNLLNKQAQIRETTIYEISLAILGWKGVGIETANVIRKALSTNSSYLKLNQSDSWCLNREEHIDSLGWQAIGIILQLNTHFTAVNLHCLELGNLGTAGWQALCLALQQAPHVSTLKLADNSLGQLDSASWQAFQLVMQQPNLDTLCLRANNLHLVTQSGWLYLERALKACALGSLHLGSNKLGNLHSGNWLIMCEGLQAAEIQSLHFDDNDLNLVDPKCLNSFCKVIQAPCLTKLDLSSNRLDELSATSWEILCSAIETSNITRLDLSCNNLAALDFEIWQMLCTAIQASKITYLNMDHNYPPMHCSSWKIFELLFEKLTIEITGVSNVTAPKFIDFNNRNMYFRKALHLANKINIKKKLPANLTSTEEAITTILKALDGIKDKLTQSAKELRAKLQHCLDELYWHQADLIKKNVPQNKPIEHQAAITQAIRILLAISPQGEHYEDARCELFQLAHLNLTKENASTRFVKALPYLLNEDEIFFVSLKEDNQRVFDGYLFAAAGGRGLGKSLTSDQRLALLQYILLLNLTSHYQCVHATRKMCRFFDLNNHEIRLRNAVSLMTFKPENIDLQTQEKLQSVWAEVNKNLDKIYIDEELQIMFAIVTQMSLSLGVIKPTLQINTRTV